jgi:hypothetical protein
VICDSAGPSRRLHDSVIVVAVRSPPIGASKLIRDPALPGQHGALQPSRRPFERPLYLRVSRWKSWR